MNCLPTSLFKIKNRIPHYSSSRVKETVLKSKPSGGHNLVNHHQVSPVPECCLVFPSTCSPWFCSPRALVLLGGLIPNSGQDLGPDLTDKNKNISSHCLKISLKQLAKVWGGRESLINSSWVAIWWCVSKLYRYITFDLAIELLKFYSKERIEQGHEDVLCSMAYKTHPLSLIFVPSLLSGYSGFRSVSLSSPFFSNIPKVPTSHLKAPSSVSLAPFQCLQSPSESLLPWQSSGNTQAMARCPQLCAQPLLFPSGTSGHLGWVMESTPFFVIVVSSNAMFCFIVNFHFGKVNPWSGFLNVFQWYLSIYSEKTRTFSSLTQAPCYLCQGQTQLPGQYIWRWAYGSTLIPSLPFSFNTIS